jgi:hypothetical protein
MAGFVMDTLRKTVSGAVVAGREWGGRAVATAGPRIVSAVDAVRARFTGPHAVAPAPPIPTKPESAPSPTQHEPRAPSPASVAKNIAKHDPANDPVIPKRKPVKRSVPGARLPAHKKADGAT